ncbi:MAG: hypothetical protein IPM98_04555 [Lewinellaceae bacterium]|nr:hypothetical protein [Lewinellaceae bacterium]
MKKTFANFVQKSLVAALLVFGTLLLGTSRAEAQSSGAETWPTNWVDSGEAMLRVKADVDALRNDPLVQTVGSDSNIRVHYYKATYNLLAGGMEVPAAIVSALGPTGGNPALETGIAPAPGVNLNGAQRDNLLNYMKNRLSL